MSLFNIVLNKSFRNNNILKYGRNFTHNATNNIREREKMYYDVVCVGGGPAGLSAAIKLKQLSKENGIDLSVCVIDKGVEIGAHILSGNVFEPKALDELFPNWKEMDTPLLTEAKEDKFLILTEKYSYKIPNFLLPSQLHNHGNYIISLSQLTRWLAMQAESLGVEIYAGFAASDVIYGKNGNVQGIITKDAGIGKDGKPKDTFTPGIELIARQTLFAEGCRGSCTEDIISKFNLRNGKDEQSYGLGIKEVWTIPNENFKKGYIQHTLGWPLQSSPFSDTFGGTFLYHQEPNLVLLGMVIGLDYSNTYINPYKEFQRWKHHPSVSSQLKGGECISYGARVLNEGGYHAIPKLTFPGGALIGCSAGFLNAVKIKGTHTAMKSGMLAAETIYPLLAKKDKTVAFTGLYNYDDDIVGIEPIDYETRLYSSWVGEELKIVRNTHASFHYGTIAGLIHTALSCFISKGSEPWTIKNLVKDSAKTKPIKDCTKIDYPNPDGVLSFDLLSNLQRSGTNHDHDQPAHLKIKDNLKHVPSEISIKEYDGPEQRFCPAGVYEYTEADTKGSRKLVINAQNCVHCKCCSIKATKEFIKWTVPEGGGGPSYTIM